MSLNEIGTLLAEHKFAATAIVILVLSLIQVTPIKLNPWSWLINGLRSVFGIKDLNEKMEKVETQITKNQKETNEKIEQLEERVDKGQAIQARVRILRFGDDVRRKVKRSKESYEQTMDDITRYKQYCQSHPNFKNDMTVLTVQIIEEDFKRCMKENDFL